MTAWMVRSGGIMAFVMILVVLALGSLVAWMAFVALVSGSPRTRDEVQVILALLSGVSLPIGAFVLWTTGGLFRASGYRAADRSVLMLMVLLAVNLIHLLDGEYHLPIAVMWEIGSFSVLGILSQVAPLAVVLFWMWFSFLAIRFGKWTGSGLWQAIGIIYLIGMPSVAVGMVSYMFGYDETSPVLVAIAAPVLLVGWACHGVGLIAGARGMARARHGPD